MIQIYLMNFFLAIATAMGMAFLPLLVTENLGLSLLFLGIIEGSNELLSNILRLVTGRIFDKIKDKKIIFIISALLAFLSKLVLFIPNSFTLILSKTIERATNGIFAVSRDAYVGNNSPNKGLSLGLLTVTKTLGCIIGPILISYYTYLVGTLSENISYIIAFTCLMSLIALFISFGVKSDRRGQINNKIDIANFRELISICYNIYPILLLGFIFFLGRFNDGVIMLYLKSRGFPEWFYLATISFFNMAMIIISPIIGKLIDMKMEYKALFVTIFALLFFNIIFLNTDSVSYIFALSGLICWGIQRAGAQITFIAMLFNRANPSYYGTIVGVYSIISGISVFISSMLCGYLAQISFDYVFILSGSASLVTLALALYMKMRRVL
ncbi:MAG: MFS transporter [Rickettsiaceae bacterium]|nr:MFS transporter [Rickettsiaceae bacterium]